MQPPKINFQHYYFFAETFQYFKIIAFRFSSKFLQGLLTETSWRKIIWKSDKNNFEIMTYVGKFWVDSDTKRWHVNWGKLWNNWRLGMMPDVLWSFGKFQRKSALKFWQRISLSYSLNFLVEFPKISYETFLKFFFEVSLFAFTKFYLYDSFVRISKKY